MNSSIDLLKKFVELSPSDKRPLSSLERRVSPSRQMCQFDMRGYGKECLVSSLYGKKSKKLVSAKDLDRREESGRAYSPERELDQMPTKTKNESNFLDVMLDHVDKGNKRNVSGMIKRPRLGSKQLSQAKDLKPHKDKESRPSGNKPGKESKQRVSETAEKDNEDSNNKTPEEKINEILEMLDSEEISSDSNPIINIIDIEKIDEFVDIDNIPNIDVFDKNNPYNGANDVNDELDMYMIDSGPNEDYVDDENEN